MLIQLPNDAIASGFQKSERNRFEVEQVFYSPKHNFRGTERDFVKAGFAYAYVQVDKHTRRTVNLP